LKNKNGFNGSINPKSLNGVNGHDTNGHVFEKGTEPESNYKNNKKPVAFSTHEAILTHKQIKEPHLNELYQLNAGIYHPTKPLPLPAFEGMPVPIPGGFCEKSGTTVIFDEDVHLNLGKPEYVRLLGQNSFETRDASSKLGARADPVGPATKYRSNFAFSGPFQLLSDAGIEVFRRIIQNSKVDMAGDSKSSRGNKRIIRGLYYSSKWVRDLQNSPKLRKFFEQIAGEELVPHPSFSNSPQVNISYAGGTKGPVDHWHWDSVAYTGVTLLSDMSQMKGGNLEICTVNKEVALEKIARGEHVEKQTVMYEKPGKMILAQGSEVLHHVTPVESKQERISVIFAFAPANCFQPAKNVLDTMRKLDAKHNLGDYEYFRENSWQALNVLEYYLKNVKYTNDGKALGRKLQSIGELLTYHGLVLEGKINDSFQVMDEEAGKLVTDFSDLNGGDSKNVEHEYVHLN